MSTPTPEEIKDQVLADALDGASTIQIGDRSISKYPLKDRLDAAKQAETDVSSPFIKVGFKKRGF